jgi:hypothetical protein
MGEIAGTDIAHFILFSPLVYLAYWKRRRSLRLKKIDGDNLKRQSILDKPWLVILLTLAFIFMLDLLALGLFKYALAFFK